MPDLTSPQPPSTKSIKAPRKRRGGLLNLLLLVGIIVTISLFVWAEQQRREAQSKLKETATQLEELRKNAQASGQEVANEVLGKLRKHMDIPTDPEPTVATIVDANALKEANEFYKPAENGDHLIITGTRAILYDADRDIILDVVPVTVDPNASPAPGTSGSPTPATSGSPAPSASPTPVTSAPAGPANGGAGTPTPSPVR